MTLNTLSVRKRCSTPSVHQSRQATGPPGPASSSLLHSSHRLLQDYRRSLLLPVLPWPTSSRVSFWGSSPAMAPNVWSLWTCRPPRRERSCGLLCLPWPEAWGLAGSTTGCSRGGGAEGGIGTDSTQQTCFNPLLSLTSLLPLLNFTFCRPSSLFTSLHGRSTSHFSAHHFWFLFPSCPTRANTLPRCL